MVNLEKIYAYIDDHKEEHIEKVQELLRQPSVHTDPVAINECARLIRGYLADLGCSEAKVVETGGNPVVYGEYDAGAEKTLIIYMMYDTQPFKEEKWISHPLEARLVEMKPFGRCVIARGALNTKGPLRAFLNAVESIKAVGEESPVNLIFVIEGEEEPGSIHLPDFIVEYMDRLKDADAVFFPWASQDEEGRVKMYLGFKGCVCFDLVCSGRLWRRGPSQYDIHSSHKAWTDSPVWRMIHALKTMIAEDGNRILIEDWYENVKPPSREDEKLISDLLNSFDEEAIKKDAGFQHFINDLHGRDLLVKFLYGTTLNISGIHTGYTGPAFGVTILPHEIRVKFDVRLVPEQRTEEIIPKIRRHLDKHGYQDIQIIYGCGYNWSKTSIKEPIVQALIEAYRDFGFKPEIWPHSGGTAPLCYFNREPLRLPFSWGGLGHGGRIHSPNEYFVIDGNKRVGGLDMCEKSYVTLLTRFAQYKSRHK